MSAAIVAKRGSALSAQQGIVMWVAIAVLIVMSLTGLAMMRQMGGSLSIAGNVAFKENATSSADAGTEMARDWYRLQSTATLQTDSPANAAAGYYATWNGSLDPAALPWNGGSVAVAIDAGQGNNSQYIIQRLCLNAGSVTAIGQVCSDYEVPPADKGVDQNYKPPAMPEIKPYFRVTTRVAGPRNTVSYTQVILN